MPSTGSERQALDTDAAVRTATSIGPCRGSSGFAAYFSDLPAHACVLDAATGTPLRKVKVEGHPAARVTGAPTLHDGVLHVPISSIEEASKAIGLFGTAVTIGVGLRQTSLWLGFYSIASTFR